MNKAKLNFSFDGKKSVTIVFADGTESEVYFSKGQAFEAIVKFTNEKKISPSEFKQMRDQILETPVEKLPSEIKDEVKETNSTGRNSKSSDEPFTSIFYEMILAEIIGDAVFGREDQIPEVEKPTFIPCRCGEKHGNIVTKTHYTPPFNSFEDGKELTKKFLKRGLMTKTEEVTVTEEMEKFFTKQKPDAK